MRSGVTITGMDELLAKLRSMDSAMRDEMVLTALEAGGETIRNAAVAAAPRKTGTLRRSIIVKRIGGGLVGVGPTVKYGRLQEYGGTIVPKRTKFLAIPITPAGKAAVSPLNFRSPLHFVGNDSRGVMADASGVAHFALVKSVTIPAHPYLRPAVDNNRAAIQRKVGAVLRQLLRSA